MYLIILWLVAIVFYIIPVAVCVHMTWTDVQKMDEIKIQDLFYFMLSFCPFLNLMASCRVYGDLLTDFLNITIWKRKH